MPPPPPAPADRLTPRSLATNLGARRAALRRRRFDYGYGRRRRLRRAFWYSTSSAASPKGVGVERERPPHLRTRLFRRRCCRHIIYYIILWYPTLIPPLSPLLLLPRQMCDGTTRARSFTPMPPPHARRDPIARQPRRSDISQSFFRLHSICRGPSLPPSRVP